MSECDAEKFTEFVATFYGYYALSGRPKLVEQQLVGYS